ncbi:BppU family phage baseplate upper protein [Lactobacillus hominis]|uniref:BppU family phage baseplate upper protein n=1 Tax=Lactobacillus hominis TaxID=1203033 RepID=UPI0023F29F1C|nr:BppU family phage baseplate upper protein [Lactobacillus hominis]
MSLPRDLSLETNKDLTNFEGLTLRQTEKGLVLHTTLLNFDKSPYDLTNKKVIFNEHKDNEKYVVDDSVAIEDKTHGIISYKLHDQVYAAKGTAWFEIQNEDGSVVDSTQNFIINVKDAANASIYNSNYVPSLERLRDQMQNLIDQAQKIENDQTTKFTQDLTNNLKNAQTQLNTKLTSMQQAYDNLENQRTSAFNTSQDNRQNAFNQSEKSRSDTYTQDKTKRDADWTADKARIDKDWSADKARIDKDWSSQKSSIQSSADKQHTDIGTAWDDKKKSIDSEWQTKKATLDSTIADLSKKLSDIQTSLTDLSNTKLPAMNKYADDVQKKVTQLKADFNAIDFSSYAKNSEVAVARAVPYPIGVTDLDQLPEGRYNTRNLTADQWQKIAHIPPIDQYGMIICYREDSDGWQLAYSTNNPSIIFYRGAGGGKYVDWQQIKQPSSTYSNKEIDDKIAANKPDWTKLTNKPKYRYSLFNGNIHFNETSGNFEWFTKNYTSNEVSGSGTMAIDLDDDAELQRTARALNDIKNKAYSSLPLAGGNMNLHSTINWNGGSINDRSGNLGGLTWTGGTDNAKIYGDQNGNDNLDLVIDLGDDNSNHISFRWNGAEKAAIDSGGKFTGRINWDHIDGRPDINSLQQQINQLKSTMPDIHVVNSEAEGNTYLASHPNAIIMVKG